MTYTDISLDLETLSTSPNAMILSIGFCFFNRKTGEIGRRNQFFVSPLSQPTRDISFSTLKWWLSQSKDAKADMIAGQKRSKHLDLALRLLSINIEMLSDPDDFRVWGKGPEFDNVILQTACKGKPPWMHWANNSVRTATLMSDDITGGRIEKEMKFEGTKHDAKADAIHQARLVIECYKRIGK